MNSGPAPTRSCGRPVLLLVACAVLLSAAALCAQPPVDPRALAVEAINATPPFLLRVDVDRPQRVYRNGEFIQVSVRSERAGYLYLFYCDASQNVTCLFPNQIQKDNYIPAGETVVVPAAESQFRLRVGRPFGSEVLKAVVTTSPLAALELQSLTKGGFAAVQPKNLKAVFVEVQGAGGPGEPAGPRQWAEHYLQLTTVGDQEAVPAQPTLAALPQLPGDVPVESPSVTTPPATAERSAKRVGVFIGVSKYEDQSIRPLRAAAKDATTMAAVMRQQGKLQETVLLVDHNATLDNIRRVVQDGLPATTSPGDLVIIYWSGHGGRTSNLDGTESDGYDEYLVPSNGRLEPADAIRSTMLLDKTFGRWLLSLDGRRVIVILDACHSGGQSQGAIKALTANAPATPFRKFFFANMLKRTKDIGQRETAVLASSRASQISLEQRGENLSVMTQLLVERLASGSEPVTLQQAATELIQRVPAYVEAHFPGTTQTPVFVDYTTAPIFLRP